MVRSEKEYLTEMIDNLRYKIIDVDIKKAAILSEYQAKRNCYVDEKFNAEQRLAELQKGVSE